ncbi:CBO0543 family protein [Paenibacillus mucilaginosus]|uniref:Uncharacterized protein n=1 Tax=Paenibacillus mucilaginosus (strain KNP414) TaxID=1036673 RepID=F8FBY5_PAEMK|nr:CBO0543 family protein [Paenibacillus mucilaginosus]AEI43746.1 hypothetical protein KNP414_05222 [Paenibacillus mucilaginosus KNP414]MCG7212729.1 hypothetical protein [Paenibacillus mucilaginosus]
MDRDQAIRLNDANVEQIERLLHQKVQIWAEHIVLTPLWWLGVALSIVPWIVWYCIRERQCTDRILYAGLFVMCLSLMLDIVGDQFGYWHYRYNVLPLVPTYFPWDLTLMPVTVMLLLQYKPGANPLLKALFFSLLTSYAAEPFLPGCKCIKSRTGGTPTRCPSSLPSISSPTISPAGTNFSRSRGFDAEKEMPSRRTNLPCTVRQIALSLPAGFPATRHSKEQSLPSGADCFYFVPARPAPSAPSPEKAYSPVRFTKFIPPSQK